LFTKTELHGRAQPLQQVDVVRLAFEVVVVTVY